MQSGQFREYADAEQLAVALSTAVASEICSAVRARGECHIVVPGGSSPRRFFEILRDRELPWKSLHLYPSDERCVPVGDSERNDRMLEEVLFDGTGVPAENLHRIPAELGPEEGAQRYTLLLQNVPVFDIAILGVGTDGHIASLFAGHPALNDRRDAVPVLAAPKPPSSRVSIGLRRLQLATSRHVIALGVEKRPAVCVVGRSGSLPAGLLEAIVWCAWI